MGRPPTSAKRPPLMPPIHGAYRRGYCKEGHPALPLKRSAPGDLSEVKIGKEGRELLERQSLEIFTLMSNAGFSFAESLSAILLTGISWGANGTKVKEKTGAIHPKGQQEQEKTPVKGSRLFGM